MKADEPTSGANQPPDPSGFQQALIEHSPLPMATVDGASHIVHYVNPAFCRLMDKPMEQLIGKPLSELLPANDICVSLLDRVYRTGKFESHTEQKHSTSSPIFWSYMAWPLRADARLVGVVIQVTETAQFHRTTVAMNEALMLGSVRQHELVDAAEKLNAQLHAEIAERKRAENALRETEAKSRILFEKAEAARINAETATRAKDDFLAALSHELRTPLTPALLLASSLAEDAELPPRALSDIEIIRKAIALQAQLVDDLLDIARITRGKLRLDFHPLDVHTALRHTNEIVAGEAQERQIEIRLDLAASEHFIEADAVRVQQIFWNILKNGLKFTPPRGVVTVRTSNPVQDKGTLLIEITDTGIGIEPGMLGNIFDAFVQGEHTAGHRFGGLGLGLAIVRKLVELQNGCIRAQSGGRDQGTTFSIEFPLAVAPAADSPQPTVSTSPKQPKRRILLVEDHDITRIALARLLERLGHQVTAAATAAQARELAGTSKCDLIISDVGLPDEDGHTLVADLRKTHGLPAIALSGYGMDEDLERSRKSGFFIHLTKPVDIHALKEVIAAAPLASSPGLGLGRNNHI